MMAACPPSWSYTTCENVDVASWRKLSTFGFITDFHDCLGGAKLSGHRVVVKGVLKYMPRRASEEPTRPALVADMADMADMAAHAGEAAALLKALAHPA